MQRIEPTKPTIPKPYLIFSDVAEGEIVAVDQNGRRIAGEITEDALIETLADIGYNPNPILTHIADVNHAIGELWRDDKLIYYPQEGIHDYL